MCVCVCESGREGKGEGEGEGEGEGGREGQKLSSCKLFFEEQGNTKNEETTE